MASPHKKIVEHITVLRDMTTRPYLNHRVAEQAVEYGRNMANWKATSRVQRQQLLDLSANVEGRLEAAWNASSQAGM